MQLLFTFFITDIYQNTTNVSYSLFCGFYLNVQLFYLLLFVFRNFFCVQQRLLKIYISGMGITSLIYWYFCLFIIKWIFKRLFAYSSYCTFWNDSLLLFLLVTVESLLFSCFLLWLLCLLWHCYFLPFLNVTAFLSSTDFSLQI